MPTRAETDTVRRLKAALGPQFEVVRLFGRGGFAEVYEVRDTELERRLAVKVLRSDMAWTPGMLQRFKQEARSVAQLTHPNTVPIHFVGEGEGLVFYVMPFIEGVTLADVMRAEGALDPERAITVALPVLEALDHAHRAGIVHRDIKPDNILIEAGSGRPLLVDFGISKRVNETTPMAEPHEGVIFGTPIYMSPEQALGQHDVDARTDIYAMGALLYHLIVGAPPFTGETAHDIVAKHLTEPVRFPPDAPEIPSWLCDVILRAMSKQPEDRYPSAATMLEPLRQGARRKRAAGLITASRVLSRVNRDDPTIQLDAAPERRRITERRFILTGALAVGALGAAAALVGRPAPEFVVENAFSEPVEITVNGDSQRTLRPGDSLRMELPRGAPLSAEWQVVGPRSANGDRIGESLGGTIREAEPEGHIRRRLDMAAASTGYIVPRITNTTDESLRVFLHDSTGARRCDCDVPPGASDVPLGYLRPDRTLAVTLVGRGGGRITYRSDSLASLASAGTGIVPLRVGRADLAVPIAANTRRRPDPRPTEPVSDLPDLMISVPPPLPVDSSPFVPDSVASKTDSTAEQKKDDPLGPIFQNR
ncbi:MAG TPA: serine/threonine-protein kinase [Gemmatimonadales bacterium]|nr:serine/threonine-protein kinase [Gemmatimonadales bacterium]